MKRVNIVCMKWGDKFDASYVNRLYGMVNRNLTLPFRFVCFTENSNDIREEVEIKPLPELDIDPSLPERGWRKLTMFQKKLEDLVGLTLFLDLDVVIVDNIDDFFKIKGDFFISFDGRKQKYGVGNSSVFRFEIGKYPQVYEKFIHNFDKIRGEVRHEQAYLCREMVKLGKFNFWEREWVVSFKYHCIPTFPFNFFKKPFIPNNAKIIIFHGLPNPPEAAKGISGKWYRKFKPATWINDCWKE